MNARAWREVLEEEQRRDEESLEFALHYGFTECRLYYSAFAFRSYYPPAILHPIEPIEPRPWYLQEAQEALKFALGEP